MVQGERARESEVVSESSALGTRAKEHTSASRDSTLVAGLVAMLALLILVAIVPPLINLRTGTIRVQRTNAVQSFQDARSSVARVIQTMQAAERGYVITQAPVFLDTYQAAETQLAADLENLRQSAPVVRSDLAADVSELETQIAEWHALVSTRLQRIHEDDLAGVVSDISSGRGQQLFDAAVHKLDYLNTVGREERALIAANATRLQLVAGSGAIILGLLAVVPGTYMVHLFRRSAGLTRAVAEQRDRAEQATLASNEQLTETRRRNGQLTTLNQLAAASAAPLAVRTRADGLLGVLTPALKADYGAIWLREAPRGPLRLVAQGGDIDEAAHDDQAIDVEAGLERLLSTSQPLVIAAHGPDTLIPGNPLLWGSGSSIHSALLLPLQGREGPIGFLVLASTTPATFRHEDREYYTTIANQAGLALDNAGLYENLSRDRQRLRAIFDQSPEGVIFAEAESAAIVLANQAALNLLGDGELTGRKLTEPSLVGQFLRPDGTPYDAGDLPPLRAIAGVAEARAEVIIKQQAGTRIPAFVTAVPVKDEGGMVRGVVAVVQDLSRLREVERLKSDFVAMVSHELRTPLTAIQGSVQTLLRTAEIGNGRVREFLAVIDEQSNRLQELIDNLLSLSQVEAGALRLRRQPVDIERLIRSIVRQSGELMPNLHVQAQIPVPLPIIGADARRLEQVVLNLLDNARKASPSGGVITVSAVLGDGTIEIGVQDQGPGIAPSDHTRVFERFYQGTQQPGIGGTGLGLAICRALVEAHGGRIWVSDSDQPGAVVQFTVPIAYTGDMNTAEIMSLETVIERAHETRHILVVDDESALRQVLGSNLTNAGYTVDLVAEGVAALEHAVTERPDLILLDLFLPGEDGFQMLQCLRDFTDVPIMMLTASSDERHVVRGLQLGADDYLVKPFKMDELLARVEALLRRTRASVESRGPTIIVAGDLTIDLARHAVRRDDEEIDLTPTEYRLLTCLARHAGQVLTHEQLLHQVWGPEYGGENQYLWVHIGRLRQKIESTPSKPRHILTERGVGYRFEL